MLETYDVGSLPPRVEESAIYEGARRSQTILSLVSASDESKVFEDEVVNAYIDKLNTGLTIPNYPQFRDMNEMFFELIRGMEKTDAGYLALQNLSAKPNSSIPEVDVIKRNTSKIRDRTEIERIKLKTCVTGPYTLASFFQAKTPRLFEDLGIAVSDILSRSMFNTRGGEVALVCIDEPVLGFLNDPLLDYGSEGRGALIRAWDRICHTATSRGAETSMHLHDTSDDLFWDVEHLGLVESHVDDPLYTLESTKRRLEETDKRLKASITVTLFDNLIENRVRTEGFSGEIQERIGDAWTEIRHGRIDPLVYVEEAALMSHRLEKVVDRFGVERVPYAGPECGFGGWPGYDYAFEGLRRVSAAIQKFHKQHE